MSMLVHSNHAHEWDSTTPPSRRLKQLLLALNHALLDRLNRHAFGADKLHRRLDVGFIAAQEHGHDPDLVLHARLADIKHHVRELAAHLPDDGLLHLRPRGEREPATLAIRGCWH